MRNIFKHGPSPCIEACEALTGLPPVDMYCENIAIKFAIKIRQNDGLVRDTHLKLISIPRSQAKSLESSLKRYNRFMNKETILEYTNDQIAGSITDQWRRRWKTGLNYSLTLLQVYQHLTMFPMIYSDSCIYMLPSKLRFVSISNKLGTQLSRKRLLSR